MKTETIEDLLSQGLTVPQVARRMGVTKRWVYQYSQERGLPRNRKILPNSPLERSILKALVVTNLNFAAVGKVYSQTPANLRELVKRMKKKPI